MGYPAPAYRRSSGAAPPSRRGFQPPRSVPSPQPSRTPYRPPPTPANDNIPRSLSRGLRFAAKGLLRFIPWIGAALTVYEIWQWYTMAKGWQIPGNAEIQCDNGKVADLPPYSIGGACSTSRKLQLTSVYEANSFIKDWGPWWAWGMNQFHSYIQNEKYIRYYEAQYYRVYKPAPLPNVYEATPAGEPNTIPRPLIAPWVDPMIIPPLQPVPDPVSPPVRRPQERPNPWRDPQEQPRRYPERRPRHRPRPRRAQYSELSVSSTSTRFRNQPLRNPKSRTKLEKKAFTLYIPRVLKRVLATSEYSDVVNAVFDALPSKVKQHCLMSHQFLEECILKNWDQIDAAEAFENLVKNELQDRFYGAVGQAFKKSYGQGRFDRAHGFQLGPAL